MNPGGNDCSVPVAQRKRRLKGLTWGNHVPAFKSPNLPCLSVVFRAKVGQAATST